MGPRTAWVLCVGATLCGGCSSTSTTRRGPDREDVQPEPWPEIPGEGYVVLPGGTPVYLQPSYAGPSTRLGWPAAESPPWPTGGLVARVLGERDGFVAIAPLLHPHGTHCEQVLDGEAYDVTLYVSPWSLALVTTRVVEHEFEDGTSIVLAPGVPVRELPDDPRGRWAVGVDDVRLRLRLPDDAVGRAYAELPALPGGGRPWDAAGGEPSFSFDDGSPLLVRSRFGTHEVQVGQIAPWGSGHRVQLSSSCIEAVVLADRSPSSLTPEFEHFDFGLGAPQLGPVPPGAAALDVQALVGIEPPPPDPLLEEDLIHFPDVDDVEGELVPAPPGIFGLGTSGALVFEQGASVHLMGADPPAGTLRHLQVVHDGWVLGDRLCFATMFGTHFQPMLPVCFDAREARMQTAEDAPHDHGGTTVIPGPVRTWGAFEPGAVEPALRRHRVDLRRCFDQARLKAPVPASRVELELALEIDGRGAVTAVRRRTGTLGLTVDCAIEAAKSWSMPTPTDGKPGRVVFAATLTTEP